MDNVKTTTCAYLVISRQMGPLRHRMSTMIGWYACAHDTYLLSPVNADTMLNVE